MKLGLIDGFQRHNHRNKNTWISGLGIYEENYIICIYSILYNVSGLFEKLDSTLPLGGHSWNAAPRPVFLSQERHGPVKISPVEGHEDGQRAGMTLLRELWLFRLKKRIQKYLRAAL